MDKNLHRLDGPAYIHYGLNGDVLREHYCEHGLLHRLDGPAYIEYFTLNSNEPSLKAYYIKNNYIKVKSLEEFKQYVKLLMFNCLCLSEISCQKRKSQ